MALEIKKAVEGSAALWRVETESPGRAHSINCFA
jgi:hypothetical protein